MLPVVRRRRMRVLIVEDEYVILDDLEFFARAAGCTVIGSAPSAGVADQSTGQSCPMLPCSMFS
jgi:hypothetical protein